MIKLLKKYKPLEDSIIVTPRQFIDLEKNTVYYGECSTKSNQRHGRGIQVWVEGNIYEGYWKNDKPNGMGKLIYKDGDIYEGEFINGKANGFGVCVYANSDRYEGTWKDNMQEGKGEEIDFEGGILRGQFKQSKKYGFVKYSGTNGTYEGQFVNNDIHGKGSFN
jgi:hypothetical protein